MSTWTCVLLSLLHMAQHGSCWSRSDEKVVAKQTGSTGIRREGANEEEIAGRRNTGPVVGRQWGRASEKVTFEPRSGQGRSRFRCVTFVAVLKAEPLGLSLRVRAPSA